MMHSTTATPCQYTIPRQPTVKYALIMHTLGNTKVVLYYDTYEEAEKVILGCISKHVYKDDYYTIEKRYYP